MSDFLEVIGEMKEAADRDTDSLEAARLRNQLYLWVERLEAALAQQAGAVESDDFPFIVEVGTNGKPTGYWFRKGTKAADRYLANKADEVSDDMIDVALASAWGHKMRGDDAQRSIIRGMLQAVRREYPGFIASSAPGGGGEVCTWTCTDHPYEGVTWDSTCGVKYCFTEDGPEENGHKFCHCCGKPISVLRLETERGEDDE